MVDADDGFLPVVVCGRLDLLLLGEAFDASVKIYSAATVIYPRREGGSIIVLAPKQRRPTVVSKFIGCIRDILGTALLANIGPSADTTVSPAELLMNQQQDSEYGAEDGSPNESIVEDPNSLEH